MHNGTIAIVRIISGSEMPSTPRWYRALMTSIHSLLTWNCIFAGVVVVEVGEDPDPDGQRRQRGDEGDHLDRRLLGARHEHDDRHADERDEDREGQRPVIEPVHPV